MGGAARRKLDQEQYPFSDANRIIRRALDKLDPPKSKKPSPPTLPGGPMVGSRRKPRR